VTSETAGAKRPLVMHLIHRFATGGMENGLVNLINNMESSVCRHMIVSITENSEYRQRICRDDVEFAELHKLPGHDLSPYKNLWRLLRWVQPDVLHTRNLAGLEFQVVAALAGVPIRIHGEHGRDVTDIAGTRYKYRMLRKTVDPLIHHYTVVSDDLSNWLSGVLSIDKKKITRIYNGVDTDRFYPGKEPNHDMPSRFVGEETFIIGTVGRMEAVKSQNTLAKAFVELMNSDSCIKGKLRLVMVGDGPLLKDVRATLSGYEAAGLAWLPGERLDVPEIMRSLDLFVLPSAAEGISNTILEAMATGIATVATNVGGNPELLKEGETGFLVPPNDPPALAKAIKTCVLNRQLVYGMGKTARTHVEKNFCLDTMVQGYAELYKRLLKAHEN
jgi:sugar transferase (PEP-CTERM/EpsH1 system associated)